MKGLEFRKGGKNTMTKKKYTVTNMHCASCATMIELDLEDNNISSKCSFVDQTLEVEFNENESDEGFIEQIVQKSGYGLLAITN